MTSQRATTRRTGVDRSARSGRAREQHARGRAVATAKAGAFRDLPRRRRGSAAGSGCCRILLGEDRRHSSSTREAPTIRSSPSVEAHEELALAVVVRRRDEHVALLPADPAAAAVLAVEPAPEADERVVAPTPARSSSRPCARGSTRSSCGSVIRRSMTDVAHDVGGAAADRVAEQRVAGEAQPPLTTNATPSSECPGVAIASTRRPPVSTRPSRRGSRTGSCRLVLVRRRGRHGRACGGRASASAARARPPRAAARAARRSRRTPPRRPARRRHEGVRQPVGRPSSARRSRSQATPTRPRCARLHRVTRGLAAILVALAVAAPAAAARSASSRRSRSSGTPSSGAIGLAVPGAGPTVTREARSTRSSPGRSRARCSAARRPARRSSSSSTARRPTRSSCSSRRARRENDRYPIAVTPGPRGVLTSDSTRIDGLVSLADVAQRRARGRRGRRPGRDARAARAPDRAERPDPAAADASSSAAIAYIAALFAPGFAPRVLLVALAANLWLAGWWVVALVALAALAAAARRRVRAPCSPPTSLVLGFDPEAVALSPFGPSQAGRFYGVSNLLETMLLVPALLGAPASAGSASRSARSRSSPSPAAASARTAAA